MINKNSFCIINLVVLFFTSKIFATYQEELNRQLKERYRIQQEAISAQKFAQIYSKWSHCNHLDPIDKFVAVNQSMRQYLVYDSIFGITAGKPVVAQKNVSLETANEALFFLSSAHFSARCHLEKTRGTAERSDNILAKKITDYASRNIVCKQCNNAMWCIIS